MKIVRDYFKVGCHIYVLENDNEIALDERDEGKLVRCEEPNLTLFDIDCAINEYIAHQQDIQ